MDGSDYLGFPTRNMLAVPDPMSLVGLPGLTGAIWNGVGEVPTNVSQGWKLYVSATLANYVRTLVVVGPILHGHSIPFKYLSSLSRVRDQNAGVFGFSQVGKCIVAYLHDVSKISTLLAVLRGRLEGEEHEGPFVPRLPSAWSGASVFYRFGSYRGGRIEIAGISRLDDRSDPLSVIKLVEVNPFVSADDARTGEETRKSADVSPSILARFPAVSPICRSGKGGVFRAIDIQSPARTGVIVKIGLRLGSVLLDGRDGAHFLERESSMYQALRDSGPGDALARPIAFSREECANVLVLEELQGVDLTLHRSKIANDPSHLASAIRLIQRVHRAGFCLGDAKASNFIVRGEDLLLVDLESVSPLGESRKALPSTFVIVGLPGTSREASDILHFLVSLVCPAARDGLALSQARIIRLPDFADELVAEDAWGHEAIRLLRFALHTLQADPSLQRFDGALS